MALLGGSVAVWGPTGTPSGFRLAILKTVIARKRAQRYLSLYPSDRTLASRNTFGGFDLSIFCGGLSGSVCGPPLSNVQWLLIPCSSVPPVGYCVELNES